MPASFTIASSHISIALYIVCYKFTEMDVRTRVVPRVLISAAAASHRLSPAALPLPGAPIPVCTMVGSYKGVVTHSQVIFCPWPHYAWHCSPTTVPLTALVPSKLVRRFQGRAEFSATVHPDWLLGDFQTRPVCPEGWSSNECQGEDSKYMEYL